LQETGALQERWTCQGTPKHALGVRVSVVPAIDPNAYLSGYRVAEVRAVQPAVQLLQAV